MLQRLAAAPLSNFITNDGTELRGRKIADGIYYMGSDGTNFYTMRGADVLRSDQQTQYDPDTGEFRTGAFRTDQFGRGLGDEHNTNVIAAQPGKGSRGGGGGGAGGERELTPEERFSRGLVLGGEQAILKFAEEAGVTKGGMKLLESRLKNYAPGGETTKRIELLDNTVDSFVAFRNRLRNPASRADAPIVFQSLQKALKAFDPKSGSLGSGKDFSEALGGRTFGVVVERHVKGLVNMITGKTPNTELVADAIDGLLGEVAFIRDRRLKYEEQNIRNFGRHTFPTIPGQERFGVYATQLIENLYGDAPSGVQGGVWGGMDAAGRARQWRSAVNVTGGDFKQAAKLLNDRFGREGEPIIHLQRNKKNGTERFIYYDKKGQVRELHKAGTNSGPAAGAGAVDEFSGLTGGGGLDPMRAALMGRNGGWTHL